MSHTFVTYQTVANLSKFITFELGSTRLTRRLVITVHAPDEISIASPIGGKLANARAGDVFQVSVQGGDELIYGKVVSVQ